MNDIKLGPLSIAFGEATSYSGTPAAGGERQIGLAHKARVTGPSNIALDVARIEWAASREVAALDCHGSPQRIQRLLSGGRIGIKSVVEQRESMQLRISRMTDPDGDWSSEFQTSVVELESVTRLPAARILASFEGTAVGTRSALFADGGRQRNELSVVFPTGALQAPVVAYCLVRALPLLYRHGQEPATRAE